MPTLINLNNHLPIFEHKEVDLKVKAYVAQNIYMFDKYFSRKNEYLETGGSSVIYFVTAIDKDVKEFVFEVPMNDKRFVKYWSKDHWLKIAGLISKKSQFQESLLEIETAMTSMGYFTDIRKLAKIKRNGLKKDILGIDKEIGSLLAEIRVEGNERIVFGG